MAVAAPSRPRRVGEFDFLDAVERMVEGAGATARLGRGVRVGIGDDCAVVAGAPRTLLTTDCQIEGVHFRRGWLTARELGARAFRVAVSDIAAMGGRPRYVLLGLELPVGAAGSFDRAGAKAIVAGVASEARRCGASLVGGNVSGARYLGVTVTVIGEARRRAVLRSGARAGDLVFVTGSFGGAGAALRVLEHARVAGERAAPAATLAYRCPPLRVEAGAALAERGLVHAMIDVSDGLVQDLGHLCERSQVTIRLDSRAVPLHPSVRGASVARAGIGVAGARRADTTDTGVRLALAGGEDYELAFTAAVRCRAEIERVASRLGCPLSLVGRVEQGRARVVDMDGHPLVRLGAGFDHLRSRRKAGAASSRKLS